MSAFVTTEHHPVEGGCFSQYLQKDGCLPMTDVSTTLAEVLSLLTLLGFIKRIKAH